MSGPLDQMPPELLDPEEVKKAAEAARLAQRLKEERLAWWRLREVYERCKLIAEQVWKEDLDAAESAQRSSAASLMMSVPLGAPLDRVRFLKEATVALLVEAGKRNLTATPEPKEEPPLTNSEPAAILAP